MKKYGKVELANLMVENGSCKTKKEALEAVGAVVAAITQIVNSKDEVALVGFGNFKTVTKAARNVRHPGTGELMLVEEKTVAKFVASKSILK